MIVVKSRFNLESIQSISKKAHSSVDQVCQEDLAKEALMQCNEDRSCAFFYNNALKYVSVHGSLFKRYDRNLPIQATTSQVIITYTPFVLDKSNVSDSLFKKLFYLRIICKEPTDQSDSIQMKNCRFVVYQNMSKLELLFYVFLIVFSVGLIMINSNFRERFFAKEKALIYNCDLNNFLFLISQKNLKISLEECRGDGTINVLISRYKL